MAFNFIKQEREDTKYSKIRYCKFLLGVLSMSSIIAYLGIIVTFSAIALTLFYGLRAIKFL